MISGNIGSENSGTITNRTALANLNVLTPTTADNKTVIRATLSSSTPRFRYQRIKKEVEWQKRTVGTVDVRAEMNAFELTKQVLSLLIFK